MKKAFSLIVVFFLTVNCVFAENLVKTKLPSGQTVIVKEVHSNPVVMIDTWVKTGSIDENDKNNGVAHFLEHLFFKGSKNYPNNDFDKILEAKGAITNAATSNDFTHFYILIPSKDFETALKLHSDMLSRPLLPKNEIDKEREVVIREIERSNDNPSRTLFKKFNKALYPTHPYRREVLGTKENIAAIPREEIFDFYKKHYSPENMITVVVGDVDGKQAVKLIEKYFSETLADSQAVKNTYAQDKKPQEQTVLKDKEDINTTSLIIGYKTGLKLTDKDSLSLDLLSALLGQGKSSMMYKEIKDKRQLAEGVSANHISKKDDSVFIVSANLEEQNVDAVINNIFTLIEKLKREKVSDTELDRVKKRIERDTFFERESVSDNASEIGYVTLLTDDWNYYEKYLSKLKKITPKDIKRVANKYLNQNSSVIAVLSPKTPQPAIAEKKTSVEEKEEYTQVTPDKYFKPSRHKPVKTEKSGNLVKYTLDNGATLIIDKHKNNEIIAIDIKVKGGNYINDNGSAAKITASVLESGTERYPKEAYSDITEENGIKIASRAEKEYFEIMMQCAKQDMPLALDIFHQVLNKATLSESEIEKEKTSLLYEIKHSRNNASSVVFEELFHELWKDTPYDTTGLKTEKELPKITKKDVSDFYENVFDAKNTIIAVNGNVNEQEMIDYFSEVIKPKEHEKFDYKDYKNIFGDIKKKKVLVKNQGKESAWIAIAWKTDGLTNRKDRAALRVLNAILGSGMSSRLFSEVRAEKGLAYAIGSSDLTYINKGVFYTYIGTDPSQTDKAEKAIFEQIERIKKEPVSEKELEDAKNKIKGKAIISIEKNAEKANVISTSEQNGNGYDYYFDNFNSDIDGVTAEDVRKIANRYFSKPYIISKVLPKK